MAIRVCLIMLKIIELDWVVLGREILIQLVARFDVGHCYCGSYFSTFY